LKNRSLEKTAEFCWYALIAVLPITSMPIVASLLGSDSVASPSIIFLIILAFVWLGPSIVLNKPLHRSILPLLIFVLVSIIGTLVSFFYEIPAFKGINQFSPIISAISTLLLGFLFFVCASSLPTKRTIFDNTMRIINWSGLVIFVWSGMQVIFWFVFKEYPQWFFDMQGLISSRVLYRQRVTGFALEPSWFAHQLNMFYLPFWLSFSLHKKTNHSFKLFFLSFENLLAILGIISLFLTFSRVGLASFLMMLLLIGFSLHKIIVRIIKEKILKRNRVSNNMISIILVILYPLIIGTATVVFSKIDPRMAKLFDFSFEKDNPFITYFDQLQFGERVIYWLTGWNIFGKYPIIGVGLGNAGFYFPSSIPSEGWRLVEVSKLINRTRTLLNIKSLWFRLLAETGLVGFSLFSGWLISLSYYLIEKMRSINISKKILGYVGGFVLLGIFFEGLSIDSFALPYLWISLGIAVSATEPGNRLENSK
jgi:O-antigen ligase